MNFLSNKKLLYVNHEIRFKTCSDIFNDEISNLLQTLKNVRKKKHFHD